MGRNDAAISDNGNSWLSLGPRAPRLRLGPQHRPHHPDQRRQRTPQHIPVDIQGRPLRRLRQVSHRLTRLAGGRGGVGPQDRSTTEVTNGNKGSTTPSISGNGRFIAFSSNAHNLVLTTTISKLTCSCGTDPREAPAASPTVNATAYLLRGMTARSRSPTVVVSSFLIRRRRTSSRVTRTARATCSSGTAGPAKPDVSRPAVRGRGHLRQRSFIAYTAKSKPIRYTGHELRYLDVFVWD